jgi:hypothetical protein
MFNYRSARHRETGHNATHGGVGVNAFDLRFGPQDHAVAVDGRHQTFYVVGGDKVATLERSKRANGSFWRRIGW